MRDNPAKEKTHPASDGTATSEPTGTSKMQAAKTELDQLLTQWRNRILAQELDVSPHLRIHDIKDVTQLTGPLLARKSRPAIFLWNSMSDGAKARIRQGVAPGQDKTALIGHLVEVLNAIIAPPVVNNPSEQQKGAVWADGRFTGVKLSPETKELLARNPRPGSSGLILLNRHLLADAFPKAIERTPRDPGKFQPLGCRFPTQEELRHFDEVVCVLAQASDPRSVTSQTLARLHDRHLKLQLLPTLQLLVQRLCLVPPNPRILVKEAVASKSPERSRLVYNALVTIRDAGFELPNDWQHEVGLDELLGPGVSDGLRQALEHLKAELKNATMEPSCRGSLQRVINRAVQADLCTRAMIWNRDHGDVFALCQWLRELHGRDHSGFIHILLQDDQRLLQRLSWVHWEGFKDPKHIDQMQVWARMAQNKEHKQRKRMAEAKLAGQPPERRRRTSGSPPPDPASAGSARWQFVV